MAFHDNSPTKTYVSVKNLIITYNNLNYAIEDMYSQYKYFYWSIDNPTQIEVYNTRFDKTVEGKYLLLINDNGIHTAYPNDNIKITFAGMGVGAGGGASSSDITSLRNQLNEATIEYRTLVQGVNGQIDTIGKIVKDEEGNITEESVNKFINRVNLSEKDISTVKTAYNLTVQQEELRNNLVNSFLSLLNTMSTFKTDFDKLPIDTVIDSTNKSKILSYFTTLESQLTITKAHMDTLISTMRVDGKTEMATTLTTSETTLSTSYSNFSTMVTNSLSDNIFSTTDITNIIDRMYAFITQIQTTANTCNTAMSLGSGISVIKQGTNLLQTQESIRLQANKIESTAESLEEQIANIEINEDSIKQVVSDTITENINVALGSIKIGGTNLINGSFEINIPLEGASTDEYSYMEIGKLQANVQYTFSIESSVTLQGTTTEFSIRLYDLATDTSYFNKVIPISTTKQAVNFTTTNECSLLVYAGAMGSTLGNQIQLNKVKLETGNTPTDWTPSYDDTANELDAMGTELTKVVNLANDTLDTTESYGKRISATEKLFEEGGEYYLVKEKFSNYEQTLDGFDWRIGNTVNENGNKLNEIYTNIEFNGSGIVIGKSTSKIKLVLENDILSFQDDNNRKLAYFSDDKLVIEDVSILGDLRIGNYGIMSDDGGITIGKI